MILILGNFAGVFSNLMKLLSWSIKLNDQDKILFYYTNKAEHDNPRRLPFNDYEEDLSRIFFYKYFEYPSGCILDTFRQGTQFEMGYPEIPKESLPSFLQGYTNGFVFCSFKLFNDPSFSEIRHFYHKHMEKQLQFTFLMNTYIHKDLSIIRNLQEQGKRILAVFIRCTAHFVSYDVDKVFEEIKEVADQYDYILPITQIAPFFQKALSIFGDKCLVFPRKYLEGNVDWCRPMSDEEFEEEFCSAVRDVYLASQCDFILGGSSNMLLGALFWNPHVPFKIFKELSQKNGE